jgi:peptide/nickel transport system permease protein
MLESIRQDYIRTARAKGANEATVIWKHAFKNAMLPIINSVGISIGLMMGGTLISEQIFSMPGLGMLVMDAIQRKDVPIIMGTTIFLSAIFCLMVLLVDIVSAFADPRVKVKYVR